MELLTLGVAFSDVVVDAVMVEQGQPRGITGQLQAVGWGTATLASILTGVAGGYLSEHGQERLGFLACGLLAIIALLLSLLIREQPRTVPAGGFRAEVRALWQSATAPDVLSVGAFLLLWNFGRFYNAVLYVHMTREMGFSEQFYGAMASLLACASIAACLGYGFYCHRVSMSALVHGSIALGILNILVYWALTDRISVAVITLIAGLTYMTALLIQFDWAARVCPPRVAGTVFAILMTFINIGDSLSTYLGGQLYDRAGAVWGSGLAFRAVVGLGTVVTASCWLLLLVLPASAFRAPRGPSEA